MALGDERRASGERMAAERRASGARNAAERRAIGARIRADLSRSVIPERTSEALPALDSRGARAEQKGRSVYTPPASSAGGIASPLTEPDASTREYWPGGLASSDGIFVLPAIKVLNLTDANGAAVQIRLADPGAGA